MSSCSTEVFFRNGEWAFVKRKTLAEMFLRGTCSLPGVRMTTQTSRVETLQWIETGAPTSSSAASAAFTNLAS